MLPRSQGLRKTGFDPLLAWEWISSFVHPGCPGAPLLKQCKQSSECKTGAKGHRHQYVFVGILSGIYGNMGGFGRENKPEHGRGMPLMR